MKIYIMGICGTAMSHVALLLRQMGHEVCGTDECFFDPVLGLLKKYQIQTWQGYDVNRLKKICPDVVVVGNVVSRGNVEMEFLLDTRSIPFYTFPGFLAEKLFKQRDMWVVTGTHGKTTTTSLTAFLMKTVMNVGYFVGGLPRNFECGCALGDCDAPFIIEGDEYDTAFFDKRSKFFHYWPKTLIINNLEFDHADIFRDLKDIQRAFYQLTRMLPAHGHLILNGDDENVRALLPCDWTQVHTVGFGLENTWRIENLKEYKDSIIFDMFHRDDQLFRHMEVPLIGEFNARNVAMAYVACHVNGYVVQPRHLKRFSGVERRQTILKQSSNLVLMEDFGHHPTAIQQTLNALAVRYVDYRIIACFEPSCNTSSSIFFQKNSKFAFQFANEIWLLPPKRSLYSDRFVDCLIPIDEEEMKVELEQSGHSVSLLSDYSGLIEKIQQPSNEKRLICCFTNGRLSEKLHMCLDH